MEDKIKLQEEIRFLKESFDAGIITPEEYEERKKKLDDKIINGTKKDVEQEIKIEEKPVIEEYNTDPDPEIDVKELNGVEKSLENKTPKIESKATSKQEKKEDKDILDYVKVVDINGKEPKKKKDKISNQKNEEKSKTFALPILILIILAIIIFFSFSMCSLTIGSKNTTNSLDPKQIESSCFNDSDCSKEGNYGFCNNPGTKEAECEFKPYVEVGLTIINTDDCFNCDTSRVLTILNGWFPGLKYQKLDFGSEQAKEMIEKYSISMLPAFIFDDKLKNTSNYNRYSSAFYEKEGSYILSPTASASNYYINNPEIKNRFDAYMLSDDETNEITQENLEPFINLFSEEINYNLIIVNRNDPVVKNLNINTFPTYIINNKIKFSGILPADTIKSYFCELNQLYDCGRKLPLNLI